LTASPIYPFRRGPSKLPQSSTFEVPLFSGKSPRVLSLKSDDKIGPRSPESHRRSSSTQSISSP
jgi:hypothetical protein